jgi:cell wall-associated protease
VASVALTTSLPAPQPAGATIVWTATPTGGTGALVYKWFLSNDGVSWTTVGTWTSSNQFTWTPTVANANHRVSAWVKHASNPKDESEASSERPFAITEPSFSVSSVALTTNLPAPQPAGSTIVWTATPTGGTGPLVYKWFLSNDGVSWTAIGTWTPSNQFTWTPTAANANHRVSVWVKRASNPKNEYEATSSQPFVISEPSYPVSSVALTTDLPAPQDVSSTIVWTATPTGGTGALVFKWFVTSDGATWNAVGTWTSSNEYAWTPTDASANYGVSVWVKRTTNPVEGAEASADQGFAIQEPVTSVALTTNLASPQPLSSTIEWTATPTGGASDALVYRWFISDDDGATWTAAGPWAPSNRVTWTPTVVNPKYRVTVWVKHATDPSDYPEASAQRRFAIRK